MSNNRYPIQIFVKLSNRTITIDCLHNMTIAELREEINRKSKLPDYTYYLTFSSRVIDPSKTLEDYNISKECTIHLNIRNTSEGLKPVLKRQINVEKWEAGHTIAKANRLPCVVEINYQSGTYFVMMPLYVLGNFFLQENFCCRRNQH